MKKIYTFTLDDDIPLSDIVKGDIKLIAYYLYEKIHDMDYGSDTPILVSNNFLKVNHLYEKKDYQGYIYYFESEHMNSDSKMFNPTLINDLTFGITVYEDRIDDNKIYELLRDTMMMLKLRYNFRISSNLYYSVDDEDETKRLNIFNIFDKNPIDSNNKMVKSRKLIPLNVITKLIWG